MHFYLVPHIFLPLYWDSFKFGRVVYGYFYHNTQHLRKTLDDFCSENQHSFFIFIDWILSSPFPQNVYVEILTLRSSEWDCLAFKGGVKVKLGEGNGTPLQYSCLENPMDGGAWWAAVHGVAESRTRLSDFTFTFTHWRRKWQPTPVFLPGESQGWGSLLGFRLWGRTELDTTEAT